MSQETPQESGNTEADSNDEATDVETKQDKEYKGPFHDEDLEGIVFAQKDLLCNLQEKAGIQESRILLDSQSTVDVFCNARLLHNIWDAKRQLVLHYNAGKHWEPRKMI